MGKNLLLMGFALFILVQSPFIFALSLNCNSVSPANFETCKNILDSGITDEEKEILISNLEYSNKFFPDHDYIFNKNSEIEIKEAPEEISLKNGIFVKNAWMNILSIMPSVLYKDNLYVSDNAEVLSGFNYELKIPSNYYGGKYPAESSGDCKRIYSLIEETAENKIYVNDKYYGRGDLVNIPISEDSEIKAEYNINVEIEIKHYEWDKYCSSRWSDGSCKRYSYKCEFEYEETKKDNVKITDAVNVKHYENDLSADVQVLDTYGETIKLSVDYSNSINLDFNKSKYDFNEFVYSISYSKPPYYFYTLKAEDYGQEKLENVLKSGEDLIINIFEDCKIKAYDFFNILEKTCNSEYEDIDFYIKTDKLKYGFNEEIKVSIYPKDISVIVTYGDEEKEAIGSADFRAKFFENKITAKYKSLSSEKIIFISNKERFLIVWNLTIFVILNYLFYKILRSYWEKKQ